ncbi:hypothetical protein A3770_20p84790 [Chloropicon primus]|uniref:MYB transcription factor n=1 Tax=Chloropicon primus TaxID=1764295 RepID=A0A5B8N071_9CHLO|nr:hypothetical protein A3770_20p84790 [Chloropicon primus]|eukprot:QDZ25961.1 hypothetical protein A3770_20p84790 [Chloropicon primus]
MGAPKVRWTEEEEMALRQGVEKHGTGRWKYIKTDPDFEMVLSKRSNVDLKDKWRNILVARGDKEKPSSARKERKRKQKTVEGKTDGSKEGQESWEERGNPSESPGTSTGGGSESARTKGTPSPVSGSKKQKRPTLKQDLPKGEAVEAVEDPPPPRNGKVLAEARDIAKEGGRREREAVAATAAVPEALAGPGQGHGNAPGGGMNGVRKENPPIDQKVIAAIIALKASGHEQATAQAIFTWMAGRYDKASFPLTQQEVSRHLKSMCQENKLLREKNSLCYTLPPWDTQRHNFSISNISKKQKQKQEMRKLQHFQFQSAADAVEVAAQAVVEALAAAENAENAMAEAVALEAQATALKQQEESFRSTRPFKKR